MRGPKVTMGFNTPMVIHDLDGLEPYPSFSETSVWFCTHLAIVWGAHLEENAMYLPQLGSSDCRVPLWSTALSWWIIILYCILNWGYQLVYNIPQCQAPFFGGKRGRYLQKCERLHNQRKHALRFSFSHYHSCDSQYWAMIAFFLKSISISFLCWGFTLNRLKCLEMVVNGFRMV